MKPFRYLLFSLGLALLTAAITLAVPAPAGPTAVNPAAIGQDFLVSEAANAQYDPALAYNPEDDEFLLVYEDFRAGGLPEIYAQRLTGDGRLLGDPVPLTADGDIQNDPEVAYLPAADRYLVIWDDSRDPPNAPDVYGRLVDQNGAPDGPAFPIAGGPGGQLSAEIVANDADGVFFVVWGDTSGGLSAVMGQRVGGDGTPLGPPIAISDGSDWAGQPGLAHDPVGNRYVIAWADGRLGSTTDIFAQVVLADGTLDGGNFVVSAIVERQEWPVLAASPIDGSILIVWEDWRTGERDLYGQRLDSGGGLLPDDLPLATDPFNEEFPAVVAWPDAGQNGVNEFLVNEFLIVWQAPFGSGDVHGRRVAADGTLLGDSFVVSDQPDTQANTAVAAAAGPDPSYLVVWEDYRTFNNAGVYGQRLDAGGTRLGLHLGLTPLNGYQVAPAIAYSALSDVYLVAWPHFDAGGAMVTAYLVEGNGRLARNPITITGDTMAADLSVAVAWEPSADRFLVVWNGLRAGSIDEFDIFGQLVAADGMLVGGNFAVSDAPGRQGRPSVAVGTAFSRYLVVFETVESGGMTTNVHGQFLDAGGAPLFTATAVNFPISEVMLGDARRPHIAYGGGDDLFMVVWQDNRDADRPNYWDLLGRVVTENDGALLTAEFAIAAESDRIEAAPHVAYDDANDRFLAVWEDTILDAMAEQNIWGRLLTPGGVVASDRRALAATADFEAGPDLAYESDSGRFLLVWARGPEVVPFAPDVYAMQVRPDGAPEGATPVVAARDVQQHPAVAARAGAAEWFVAWEDYRTDVGLTRAGVYGRRQGQSFFTYVPAVFAE